MPGIGFPHALGLGQRRTGAAPPPPASGDALLTESGDHLLLENGSFLLLE